MKIKYAFNVRMILVVYITRRLFLVTSMVMKQTSQLVQTLLLKSDRRQNLGDTKSQPVLSETQPNQSDRDSSSIGSM